MRISISRGIGRRASHAPGCLAAGACLTVLLAHGARADAVLSVPAGEFASNDARWQPWRGCWELSHEVLDDPEQRRPTDVPLTRNVADPSTAIRVCVTPEGATSGVRMSTEEQGDRRHRIIRCRRRQGGQRKGNPARPEGGAGGDGCPVPPDWPHDGELDRAGVADEVTDVMVALTYPDRFTVARERGAAATSSRRTPSMTSAKTRPICGGTRRSPTPAGASPTTGTRRTS
jgi:hypothetical protein